MLNMLIPEFYEELFYSSNLNLFKLPFSFESIRKIDCNFKNYLEKVYNYSFLETKSFLKLIYTNYTIEQLKKLEELKLEYKITSYNIIAEIQNLQRIEDIPNLNLPNLKYLDLSNNNLKTISIFKFFKLQELKLFNNNLKSIQPTILPNLKRLNLCRNNFTEIPITFFPNLEELTLSGNELGDNKFPLICISPNLQKLDLSWNCLKEIPKLILPNLKILSLSSNFLEEISDLNLPNLEELYLNQNLKKLQISNLNVPNLKKLRMSNNNDLLSKKSIEYLDSLKIKDFILS